MFSDGQVKLSDQLIQVSGDMAYEVGTERGQVKLGGQQVSIEQRVVSHLPEAPPEIPKVPLKRAYIRSRSQNGSGPTGGSAREGASTGILPVTTLLFGSSSGCTSGRLSRCSIQEEAHPGDASP
jgi:hypothetical protein